MFKPDVIFQFRELSFTEWTQEMITELQTINTTGIVFNVRREPRREQRVVLIIEQFTSEEFAEELAEKTILI